MSYEEFEDMTTDELDTEIETVQEDPYFMSDKPTGLQPNRAKHERLIERQTKLFEAKFPAVEVEKKFNDDGEDITPVRTIARDNEGWMKEAMDELEGKDEAKHEELRSLLDAEIDILEEFNPDIDYDRDVPPTQEIIEAYRSLRYLNEDNIKDAAPLILLTAEAAAKMPGMGGPEAQQRILALQMLLETVEPTDDDAMNFIGEAIKFIYDIRRKGA